MRQQQSENRALRHVPQPRSVPQEGAEHWVIVADDKKAHVYQKTPKGMKLVHNTHGCCSHPFPPRAGREDFFLHDLARWLDAAEREGAYDRLLLIAPPKVLADIRARLGDNVHLRLSTPPECDVEQVIQDEIEDHLSEVMWL